jgi:raffinose/stachyose/melibiose transport system permease protein
MDGGKTSRRFTADSMLLEALRYGLLVLSTAVVGYPVLWMVLQSFKSKSEMYANMWGFPEVVRLENYGRAIEMGMLRYIANSAIVSLGAVVLILAAASLAAYAFSKFPFRGSQPLFFLFIFTLVVPMQAMIIPLYAVLVGLGVTNTYLVLILPYAAAGLPVSIFLLRAFFDTIPHELEEAAKIDGCSEFGAFWRVVLPISGPGLAAVAILQFVNAWNELALALVAIRNQSLRTIPLGLQIFVSDYVEWGPVFASLSMATIPVIIVYVLMQRHFIKGLTAGAIKG